MFTYPTSDDRFEVSLDSDGKIVDFLSGKGLAPNPEEFVRQRFLRILHFEYGYPKNEMRIEVPVNYGSKELKDQNGNPIRADIVVYKNRSAATKRDQGRIHFVVECKAPTEVGGYDQLVSYIYNTSASGGVWFNASGEEDQIKYFRRFSEPDNSLQDWTGIPRHGEHWDAVDRRRKSELLPPQDVKGLLKRCHDKLHGRGTESDEEDLTMDMVRLILAKARDEEKPGEWPDFYCTPQEYQTAEGRKDVAKRIGQLFEDVKRLNSQVFSAHEKLSVGPREICDVVIELQRYQLLPDFSSATTWDIMGHAYEEYTSAYLKRKKGQFFTNRLVTDFLVAAINPTPDDVILDPAGGSGGFLTACLRYVRNEIVRSSSTAVAKERQLDGIRKRLFMVDISKRLVKIAKTAMILNGDGHTGMTQGDSLGPYTNFDSTIVSQAGRGTPTVIFTNPPFAGVSDGRITDTATLERFSVGKVWKEEDGELKPTDQTVSEGVPPELLFFERCLDWVAPGGRVGIVMPKSFLDTQTFLPGRVLLFQNCALEAVINCHKNTFQPFTGVRTCLLVFRKLKDREEWAPDAEIFMAISRKIGQDSEGQPIYKLDSGNKPLEEVDHDLDEVLSDFLAFKNRALTESEYRFAVPRSQIDTQLKINPQLFLPSLNETIQKIAEIDELEGWTVTTLGQLESGVRIFKGPRLRSEPLIVESPGPGIERYYTPSAILQDKLDSAKWIDPRKASASQRRTIAAVRVKQGTILITRSGTIGRVAYVTRSLHNAIVSDDLIRVEIDDPKLRYYLFSYLQSPFAYDQMLRNEYGAVQQHLEPQHIRDLLVPVPDDLSALDDAIQASKNVVAVKERLASGFERSQKATSGLIADLIREVETEMAAP